jgi:hypothetical protein
MNTEQIVSAKNVNTTRGAQVIVTTATGKTVWVAKEAFDPNAETISYTAKKAGDEYVDKQGAKQVLKSDQNAFEGFGKLSKLAIIQALHAVGITPSLAL